MSWKMELSIFQLMKIFFPLHECKPLITSFLYSIFKPHWRYGNLKTTIKKQKQNSIVSMYNWEEHHERKMCSIFPLVYVLKRRMHNFQQLTYLWCDSFIYVKWIRSWILSKVVMEFYFHYGAETLYHWRTYFSTLFGVTCADVRGCPDTQCHMLHFEGIFW